jgi:hypothetical protein
MKLFSYITIDQREEMSRDCEGCEVTNLHCWPIYHCIVIAVLNLYEG